MPTGLDISMGATIPILSISIVPIIIADITTRPGIGDTRTITRPSARTTSAKIGFNLIEVSIKIWRAPVPRRRVRR